ncbi:MAG: HPF/RaiA family ribosome-associated protein [Steroidobacteraceae bacterium]
MTFPIQVSFQQMEPSPALRERIRELAARLERFSPSILRCRVRVERPAQHKQQGGLHDIRIDIAVPDDEIVVRHSHAADRAHENAYVALRDAFNAARRQLEDYERRRRGEIKRRDGVAQPAPSPRPPSRASRKAPPTGTDAKEPGGAVIVPFETRQTRR